MSRAAVLTDLDWEADARDALERVAALGAPFDAYTLTETAELRDPPHPNQWGALFKAAARAGTIRRVGFHESRRPGRNAGVCRVWAAT